MSNHGLECKICGSLMDVDVEPTAFSDKHIMCHNGCYEEVYETHQIKIYVFEEVFTVYRNETFRYKIDDTDNIQKAIEYWKLNERYLLKLLEGYVPISHKPKSIRFHEHYGAAIININAIARIQIT